MIFEIEIPDTNDYPEITAVWEASVRATHHFLTEEDIQFFRPLILEEYLNAVDVYCARNDSGRISGFIGIAEDKVEMLFVDPAARGMGIGKSLMLYAINNKNIKTVDVNEQNEQAVGFYLHLGFKVVGRSEVDAMGKPFPLLLMEL
jgi:putative acetyltransferase